MKSVRAVLVVATGLWPLTAFAHGIAVHLSTPVSAPAGFLWASVGFLLSQLALGAWIDRRGGCQSWPRAVLRSGIRLAYFILIFFGAGILATRLSTAPAPGLGLGFPVFWGLGWARVGSSFVAWNVFGLAVLLVITLIATVSESYTGIGRVVGRAVAAAVIAVVTVPILSVLAALQPWAAAVLSVVVLIGIIRRRSGELVNRRPALAAASANYLVWLLPFVLTGALSHGWTGFYTHFRCERNRLELHAALRSYAAAHQNRLPEAKDFAELNAILAAEGSIKAGLACPVGSALHEHPSSYRWDAAASGQRLEELPKGVSLISCPYHPSTPELDSRLAGDAQCDH